ncbi:hypothetical protein TRFO_28749 [Tritrichomonas foetus]|uniref:Initiator binding domain-containing protein n=1 Tax=Tritrichomonas foetus TaxID=1144522 RepID=A0A1J4JZI6_9EUKA|nr:hypothetical protein TRFO_28749 [Tritrichomonas foetus]|eukprot:OHT03904.1 hypothetical protein TRFO_28749 [Tritrichomonas foetus]
MPVADLTVRPLFWELLSNQDQEQYIELRNKVGSPSNRYNRNRRIEAFSETLDAIKLYCLKGDEDDGLRCLVCGICWIHDNISINTRQLRILIDKSKSTINGGFSKMGYGTIPMKEHYTTEIVEFMPILKRHPQELRQWSTRKLKITSATPKDTDLFFLDPESEKVVKNYYMNDNVCFQSNLFERDDDKSTKVLQKKSKKIQKQYKTQKDENHFGNNEELDDAYFFGNDFYDDESGNNIFINDDNNGNNVEDNFTDPNQKQHIIQEDGNGNNIPGYQQGNNQDFNFDFYDWSRLGNDEPGSDFNIYDNNYEFDFNNTPF